MEKRVRFRKGQQIRFLREVEKVSKLTQYELAEMVGIVGRSYRDWKREKLMMPLKALKIFKDKFGVNLPETEEILIERAKRFKSIMGRRGGIACYSKYGNFATEDGRRKGGSKTLTILRQRGIIPSAKEFFIPKSKSEDLAEFVGILLGDGGIMEGQASITLNSEADKEYLGYVVDLIKKLFKFDAPYAKRKNCNANVIYCSGIKLVNYLMKIGLKVGNKVKQQVGVPKWIDRQGNFRIACVRGLLDTDGGVFVHRYKVNGKAYRYLKICFSNRSIPLLLFVSKVLKNLGFTPKIVLNQENTKVWLYNHNEVLEYLRVVGTHNPRLLKHLGGVR